MKIVVIEWDGKQPPTTYYNGLRRLNLRVRGNKEQDPIVRRARPEDRSVIVQEGAVLVESESLARQVAYLARDNGARSVFVGECDFSEDAPGRQMTDSEREVMDRFNKVYRQRGRPAEGERDERTWVVTCPECAHTTTKESDKMVIQCPSCGGLRVASRVGNRHVFAHFPRDLEEWKDMHFVEGYFECPIFDTSVPDEPLKSVTLSEQDNEVFEGLKRSRMVMEHLVSKLHERTFRTILNDMFISRRYFSTKDRIRPRASMVVGLIERGVSSTLASLMEGKEYDVLDACVIQSDYNLIFNFYMSLKGEK